MSVRAKGRASLTAMVLALLAAATFTPVAAAAAASRPSLTQIEGEVMCVSCRESLAVAQSPQAYAERAYIRTLIAQGENKQQIEQALVAQYGPAVLGKPPAHGFNLTVYVLPPAIVALGLLVLALTLPRWRRRTREPSAIRTAAPPISSHEHERLEQELAHFDG